MELKFLMGHETEIAIQVLIVPLWNWNFTAKLDIYGPASFNRTFMELKFYRRLAGGQFILF